jgi:Pyridoxal-phosphate dependent enzyme
MSTPRCPHLLTHNHAWLITVAVAGCSALACWLVIGQSRPSADRPRSSSAVSSVSREQKDTSSSWYERQIGNTPCVYLPRLSILLKRHCWVKLENANPGGTGKDRAALRIIETAEANGALPRPVATATATATTTRTPLSHPTKTIKDHSPSHSSMTDDDMALIYRATEQSRTGGLVIEGTSGSTGISLATISALHGHGCLVIMPDDQSQEREICYGHWARRSKSCPSRLFPTPIITLMWRNDWHTSRARNSAFSPYLAINSKLKAMPRCITKRPDRRFGTNVAPTHLSCRRVRAGRLRVSANI